MSETMPMPPLAETQVRRAPTVYFIDDSATMREVIKIAFRRENFNVITCADAASALAQFEQNPPDVVITDVIMPDQDGYAVCSQIKEHAQFSATPVILMSGVVNKSVADKAIAVKADELIRKPFQPQELISRVKSLLGGGKQGAEETAQPKIEAPSALSGLFAPQTPAAAHAQYVPSSVPRPVQTQETPWPRALADAFTPKPAAPAVPAPQRPMANNVDLQKLRAEISRLELLVKKLQTELQIERQYNQALEVHVRTLTGLEQS
jgi:CheY-like chemotaxis protein